MAYFVMEFVRGRELKGFLDGGERFSRTRRCASSANCCRASILPIARASAPGRQTGNVMLDAQRRVKFTDFGVAHATDAGGDRTQAGTMVGTPSYMSPEQIQGFAGRFLH